MRKAAVRHQDFFTEILRKCMLCPRKCQVNRLEGEAGFCGLDRRMRVSHILAHHGEEPPISGGNGAGTIFFSSCNLGCIFCQNHQISHSRTGPVMPISSLADHMLALQAKGCHNIEAVTPTPQLPAFLKALGLAREKGLHIPIVYNCGGYENPDILRHLNGTVDLYLPDFKYGRAEDAELFSGVPDYPLYAVAAVSEMVRQCGDDLVMEGDIAVKGIIVRHLVLPGRTENSFEVLRMIKKISTAVPLSIMSQYTPTDPVKNHPSLSRRIKKEEYEAVVNYALDLGFEMIFTQEIDEKALTPDFSKKEPFRF